jgi:c-di-GMP-binding flagellar brake protein YcgR
MVGREDAQPREQVVEKRRHLRVDTELGVTFAIAGDPMRTTGRAVTRDISHGGACLAVHGCSGDLLGGFDELPLLDIAIDTVPGESFRARVEWVRHPAAPGAPALIGLEFHNLSAAEETAIIDLIAHALIGARVLIPKDASRRRELSPTY